MKTFRIVLIALSSLVFLAGAAFFLIGFLKPQPGGILVDTSPASSVYINGNFAGKTPFTTTQAAGQITLKVVPLVADQNLLPFETKITLVSGIQTVVRREFGPTEDDSSGDIISFDNEGGPTSGLVVISTPDNAQVSLDGVPRGFAPYKTDSISPATHQVTVKAPGYIDRIMTINTKAGFRLNLFAKLAKDVAGISATPTPAPAVQSYVTILTTPTGYLRVRTLPGTKGEEIAQIKPGEKFPYLSTDAETGWYQIQYEPVAAGLPKGITGWVSNQYATISGVIATPSASPTATPY